MNREGILRAEEGGTPGFKSDVENTSPFASEQHSQGEEVLEADHFDIFNTLSDIRDAKNVMKDVHLGPLLGNGSYGNVYLGYHVVFGKVAVKVIPIQSCAKLREFDMEVKTGLDIKHSNVTALHEWRVVQTKYYVSSAVSDDDGPCPTHVSSPFCQKASSDGSPNAVYQRLQSMRHRLYSSNCSAGFSRMSSSNSLQDIADSGDEETNTRARLWLLCSFLLCFGSIAASIAVLISCTEQGQYVAVGVGSVLQCGFILASALILWVFRTRS